MKTRIILTLVAIILSGAIAKAGRSSDKPLVDIELTWKPTTKLKDLSELVMEQLKIEKLKIEKFKDSRKQTPLAKVGENIENPKDIAPVETMSNVADYIHTNFSEILTKSGVNVTSDKATYSLSGEIKEFFVTEKDTYEASLILNLDLKKEGKKVWSGVILAKNTRFGRSYKLDNYQESFSDVIIDAALRLFNNSEFRMSFPTKKDKN